MSLSTRIAPHIPYLRRYSRAVAGSQVSGDAQVRALLEMLIADISIFPEASSDRIAVFALFARRFADLQAAIEPAAPDSAWERRSAGNLARVSPRSRQAFLLAALEDFSRGEVAEILDVTPEEAAGLLRRASEEISRQVATSILIIEDEPLIALDLEQIAQSLGHRVTGVARTRQEAIRFCRADPPGLVLADIQLADGSSGIDAVNEIVAGTPLPVIFITAFPECLLTGDCPEPTFLVGKPFDEDQVKACISQALFFNDEAHAAAA